MATTMTATMAMAPATGATKAADVAGVTGAAGVAGGSVTGGVRTLLRLEALALFAVALVLYGRFGAGWRLFALAFLAPDLSFLGYLAGARLGAIAYNAAHSLVGPLALAAVGLLGPGAALPLALIWIAHIGADRALGYGLKYADGFGMTHLGRLAGGRR
jgi:hypothetical protein